MTLEGNQLQLALSTLRATDALSTRLMNSLRHTLTDSGRAEQERAPG